MFSNRTLEIDTLFKYDKDIQNYILKIQRISDLPFEVFFLLI
jgi:hypothetical protein